MTDTFKPILRRLLVYITYVIVLLVGLLTGSTCPWYNSQAAVTARKEQRTKDVLEFNAELQKEAQILMEDCLTRSDEKWKRDLLDRDFAEFEAFELL